MGIKIDIAPKDLKTLLVILKKYLPNTLVWAFGSRVKFTAKQTSDLDLVAFINEKQTLQFSSLKEAFAESNLPFSVDIHNWNELPAAFHKNINSSYVVLQDDAKEEKPSDWKTYKLGELGILARGKSKHRPRDASFLYGGKYPFIQTGDIKAANHKISTHTQTLSDEGLKQSKLWDKGTICITIAANIADTAILDYPACFPDSVIGFVPNKEVCDIDFMEYLLQFSKRNLQSHSIGSVQDNINLGTFLNFTVEVPDLPTQTQIAQILTSLDDKIELNLQMNQTLEAMAQALFKEWFVNFNFPNFDGVLENGLPKGWRMGQLSDLCIKITKGTTPTTLKKQFTNEGINFIKVESINEVYGFIPEKFAFIDEETNELLKRSKIEENDILFTIAGTLGRIAIADVSILPANTNQAVAIIRCSSTDYINYVLFLLKSDLFLSTITSKAVHAVQANISLGVISDTEIVIPKTETLLDFNNAINPIMKKMVENNYHTQTLTQTRDTLLPKLMSGKISLNTI